MRKTVLITGASSGIGKAAARRFHEQGWNVAATMRSPDKAADLAEDQHLVRLRLDVLDTPTIEAAVADTIERFGGLDVVVNNAGYGLVGPFEAATDEQIQRQFDTNVFGVMRVTRVVLPHFRAQRRGTFVNVASMGGRITFPLYSLYHGTKWALEGFSESLQYELRPLGIYVKIVEPGPIKTDFYDRSMDVIRAEGLDVYDAMIDQAMPRMNKFGEDGAPPEAVADTILAAASDDSWKLRYAVGTKGLLVLRRLLPDWAFQGAVRRVLLD